MRPAGMFVDCVFACSKTFTTSTRNATATEVAGGSRYQTLTRVLEVLRTRQLEETDAARITCVVLF